MSVNYNFTGKRVLVTGGAGGLGTAVVRKFLDARATVFALDNNADKLALLKTNYPGVNIIQVDLRNWEKTKEEIEKILPIHHLVNNAGINGLHKLEDYTEANIDKMFSINFKPYINTAQCMTAGHRKFGLNGGSIVNISSIIDDRVPTSGFGLYCCTKAAITTLTKVMAVELAKLGIRANSVRPGLMETDILVVKSDEEKQLLQAVGKRSMERMLTKGKLSVDKTADVVLYLSTEQGDFVNGTCVTIDGGLTAT